MTPRKRAARKRWQDSYPVGQRVYVLHGGNWIPGFVSRKTATGFPVVTCGFARGSVAMFVDRKVDICIGHEGDAGRAALREAKP
jgi:hypothetical protein